jgi:hypothetical protein
VKAYEDITNNVNTARVAIGKLLMARDGTSNVGGKSELVEACPAMIARAGKLSVLESQVRSSAMMGCCFVLLMT